jgi:hypothetical protein
MSRSFLADTSAPKSIDLRANNCIIDGEFQIPVGATLGYVLTDVDGSGTARWASNSEPPGPSETLINPVEFIGIAAGAVLTTNEALPPVITATQLLNGQVLIGSTGAVPTANTITAGSNVSISNTPGGINVGVLTSPTFDNITATNISASATITGLDLAVVDSIDCKTLTASGNITADGNVTAGEVLASVVAAPDVRATSLATIATANIATLNVSGATNVGTLTSSGTINATTLSVSGTTTTSTINSSGTINAANMNIAGDSTIYQLGVTTSLTAASASVSGAISASTLTSSGGVFGATVTSSGDVNGVTGDFSGSLKLTGWDAVVSSHGTATQVGSSVNYDGPSVAITTVPLAVVPGAITFFSFNNTYIKANSIIQATVNSYTGSLGFPVLIVNTITDGNCAILIMNVSTTDIMTGTIVVGVQIS